MSIKMKKGVEPENFTGVHPSILFALGVFDGILAEVGMDITITALTDGVHRENSLHYKGRAVDVRRWVMGSRAKELVDHLRETLDPCFDVVLEKSHVHIEYDPKVGERDWLMTGVR